MKHRDVSVPKQQKGVVLAVTLIILLLVTIIGLTSMSSSSIQTFLARNVQLKQISFQRAESTAIAAEVAWDAALTTCLNTPDACSADTAPSIISNLTETVWDTGTEISAYNGKYLIEYLGWRPIAGESDKFVRLYRVTARGLGPNSVAKTEVQTIFRKCVKDDGVTCPST